MPESPLLSVPFLLFLSKGDAFMGSQRETQVMSDCQSPWTEYLHPPNVTY